MYTAAWPIAGVLPDQFDFFGQVAAAFEMLDHLAVSYRLPRGSAQL